MQSIAQNHTKQTIPYDGQHSNAARFDCFNPDPSLNHFRMNKLLRKVNPAVMAMTVLLLLGASDLFAQEQRVTGTVRSVEGNQTMPGVTVVEKGTTNGTVTDTDGNFNLVVQGGATLVMSFIGMKTVEVAVGNQSTIEVALENDMTELQEVIVIGYGTVEKRNLTSAVSATDSKQLRDIPINSASQALAGRLAGVQVVTSEGSPNAAVQVRVRGGMSITGDNSPLYVVDGVQVENALSVLGPQDIANISVLKDASATAIYGSRGANGVVIITTKKGTGDITTVSINSLFGVNKLAKQLDVWKPYDFVRYQYDRSRGSTTSENAFLSAYGAYEDIELYKGVPFVNWQDEIFGRDAKMQTNNISLSSGNKQTNFNLSVTTNYQEGIMLSSDYDRKLINFKLEHSVSKLLDVGFNVRYNNTIVNGAGTSSTQSSSLNRLRHAVKYRPLVTTGQSLDYYDPNYAQATNSNSLSLINPLLLTEAEYKQSRQTTTNFAGFLKFNFTEYVNLKSTFGVDLYNSGDYVFNDTITSVSKSNGGGQPMASIDRITRTTYNISNVLNLSVNKLAKLPENHKLDLLLGQEIYNTENTRNFQQNNFFPSGITPELAFGSMQLGTPQPSSGTSAAESKLLSFFTRASYNLSDKYFVDVSFRADGSSKFAPENRWGYFPAGALMWRASSEPFMQSISGVISDLKVRASYGTSGNNRINDYLYQQTFTANAFYTVNHNQVIGFNPSALANSSLKWEATISRNFGIDVGLWGNRLELSVDYYRNSSQDLLLNRTIPAASGYTVQVQNIGETVNKGVEIQLGGTVMDKNGFHWDANFNISFNQNDIISLGPNQNSFLVSSGWGGSNQPADFNVVVGKPVGTIWGLVTDGFYKVDDFDYDVGTATYTLKSGVPTNIGITSLAPQPGMIKFKDVDGSGTITDADRQTIGNTSPKSFGGLNQNFRYKNFDLSVFINYQFGNKILNANKLEFTSGYTVNSNLLTTMDGRWRTTNDAGVVVTSPTELADLNKNATIWSPLTTASSFYTHSWAVESGSFVRINNITLGYSLPQGLIQRLGMTKFRVYGTVTNVAVFTNYSGYDPDVNTRNNPLTQGVDYAAYPRSRGYIFGVNVTF